MKIVVFLILVVFGYSQFRLMVPSGNVSRFQNIFLPTENNFYYRARVFSQQVYRSPRFKTVEYYDMCTDMISQVWSDLPAIFNNPAVKAPCATYFGSTTIVPYYLSLSNSTNLTSSQQTDALRTHYALHRYCLQCDASFSERFDLYLNQHVCPYFDRAYCNNVCALNSTCVYYRPDLNLCYVPEIDVYFNRVDNLHLYVLPIYSFWASMISFLTGVILILVLIFFITIPDIVKTVHVMKSPEFQMTYSNRFVGFLRLVVSTKNFNVTCFYLNGIQMSIFNFLDISDLANWNGRFRTIGNALTITMVVAVFSMTLIQWLHISSVIGQEEFSIGKKIVMVVLFVVLTVWGVCGVVLYGVGTFIKETVMGYEDRYIGEGIWFFVSAGWMLIASIALTLYGIRILKKVLAIDLTVKSKIEITAILLHIKLTKAMFVYAAIAVVSQPAMLYFGLVFCISPDILTYHTFFVFNFVANCWICFMCVVFIWPTYESDAFKMTYCCCCKRKDGNGSYSALSQTPN